MSSDDLHGVTPDAKHKTRFVVVDAVGVCEQDKTTSKPLDRKASVPLQKVQVYWLPHRDRRTWKTLYQ